MARRGRGGKRKRKRQKTTTMAVEAGTVVGACSGDEVEGPSPKRIKTAREGYQKQGASASASASTRTSSSNEHAHPLLDLYFAHVWTLREFLIAHLPSTSKKRRRALASVGREQGRQVSQPDAPPHEDAEESGRRLGKLLDDTLVGDTAREPFRQDDRRWRELASLSQEATIDGSSIGSGQCSQSEVVDVAVWMLFNQPSRVMARSRHLLCHGYTRSSAHGHGVLAHGPAAGIPGLVSCYPNSAVSALKGPLWAEVLRLLGKEGERVMLHLLLHCSIFSKAQTGTGNYFQLSGLPLCDLAPKDAPEKHSPMGVARRAEANVSVPGKKDASKEKRPLHTPGTIHFVRSRMLYARASLNAKGNVRFGLKHIHVLNRFSDHTDMTHTVHVMRYLFPRQFGLHNAFTSPVDSRETVQPFMDYTLREQEITRAARPKPTGRQDATTLKIPKRLRGSLPALVAKLQKLHQRCSYLELLLHYCPFEDAQGPANHDTSRSEALDVEVPRRSLGGSSGPLLKRRRKWVSACQQDDPQRSFLDLATPTASVSAFCRAVVANVFPNEFWGRGEAQAHNKGVVVRRVDQFVNLRRFENLSLHEVVQGCKITEIPWLAPPKCSKGHVSSSDFQKRSEIFAELIYYLFDSFLVPLIRSNFHVTESSAHRNRLFFFRQDVWRSLSKPAISSLKASMFEEIPVEKATKALETRPLGFSLVRLLPKDVGTRPIINLRRRVRQRLYGKMALGRSINFVLAPVYNMLNYEKTSHPSRLGSSMFSVADMYLRLKAYKSRLQQLGMAKPPLYFVKVDVRSCFDTIPQRAVLALIECLTRHSEYRMERHVQIRPSTRDDILSRPRRKFHANAAATDDFYTFGEHVDQTLAQGKRNTVFVSHAVPTTQRADKLLDLLRAHITQNLVKMGKKYYRQREGIPQGSVLSTLLCNFFYADLERSRLGFLDQKEDGRDLLVRLIDDFLLITPSRERAERFLGVMHRGVPAYGVTTHVGKSLVNFGVEVDGQRVPRLDRGSSSFPYCGILIDVQTLEISKDRSQKEGARLSDALSVELSKVPGRTFHRKTLSTFGLQAKHMFLDTDLNTVPTVLGNLYGSFLESAMKVHRYLRCLPAEKRPRPALLIATIRDLIEMAFALQKSRERTSSSHSSAKDPLDSAPGGFRCAITKDQIRWLAQTAFHTALARKQTSYREVLAWLATELQSSPRTNKIRGLKAAVLRRVVKEAGKTFEGYRY